MTIKKLYLQDFLSYKQFSLEFHNGLNIIRGKNASGKTNLLEAIVMSSIGRPARTIKDKNLIRWEASEGAKIEVYLTKILGDFTISIYIDTSAKKYIKINGLPIARLSELLGILNIVYFSPDEMKLIKESPSDRRRFLNISLSQQNKNYFYNLSKYNKLLQQRNKILKDYKDTPSLTKLIGLVDDSIMPCLEYIVTCRKNFIEALRPFAGKQHREITCGKESLDIKYETEEIDFSNVGESMQKIFEKNFNKDRKLQYTSSGIHRDDLKIMAGGIDVRKFGSQGQQRTAVLSLKLAEVLMFRNTTKEYPILLLDDVLSELDYQRQKALLSATANMQTIITCTDFDNSLINQPYLDIDIINKHYEMWSKNV